MLDGLVYGLTFAIGRTQEGPGDLARHPFSTDILQGQGDKVQFDRADQNRKSRIRASAHQMIVVASRIANWASAARRRKTDGAQTGKRGKFPAPSYRMT